MHSFVVFAALLACASAQYYTTGLGYAAVSPYVYSYAPTHHVAQAGSTLTNPGALHVAPLPQDTPEVTAAKINHFQAHGEALLRAGRKRRGVVAYNGLGYTGLGYTAPVAYSTAVASPVAYHATTVAAAHPVAYGYSGLGYGYSGLGYNALVHG